MSHGVGTRLAALMSWWRNLRIVIEKELGPIDILDLPQSKHNAVKKQ